MYSTDLDRVALWMEGLEVDPAALEPLAEEAGHLGGVGHVVVHELAPDSRDGHEVRVGDVGVRVDRGGYLTRTR